MPENFKTFQNKQERKQAFKNKQGSTRKVVNMLHLLTNALKLNKVKHINCLEGIF